MIVEGVERSLMPKLRTFLVLGIAAALGLAGVLSLAGGTAQAKVKQPGCAKFAKQKRKAKNGDQKRRAKSKLKQCRANAKVYNQVKNSRYVGARSDGEPVDLIFCANGKFADDLGSSIERIYGKGWRITDARVKGKNFTAVHEVPEKGGFRIGSLVRRNGKWQSGSENSGESDLLGDVTRTNATKECRQI